MLKIRNVDVILLGLVIFHWQPATINACDELFEGFGIHLGSIDHFVPSRAKTIPQVVHRIYNDLKIRHFRTSLESTFSPRSHVYEIACRSNARICSWIDIHNEISKYPNISIMGSIWSPPSYMMNTSSHTLPVDQETNFYHFIRNVTQLIEIKFNITIEKVSPINEPENFLASWEHTVMRPEQLCRMVDDFNDPLISVCPESAYFTTSVNFATLSTPRCLDSCNIFATHAYKLTVGGENNFKAHYDLVPRARTFSSDVPIWQTEVCSTYDNAAINQMSEALDLATNIANFVGYTCIQRYYYWYAYTLNPSGESLIRGTVNGHLQFPKKYFAYKHFTSAAYGGSKTVTKYDPMTGVTYLTFGESKAVFVNLLSSTVAAQWTNTLGCTRNTFFCTTDRQNWIGSGNGTILPAQSICSCDVNVKV